MTNPPYILDQMGAVCRALRHPNVFAFLHVPVQSGADPVLKVTQVKRHQSDIDKVSKVS